MPSYDVHAVSSAPPSVVWRLVADSSSWPAWSPVDALEPDHSRGHDPAGNDGVGAVRAFRTGRVITSERLTTVEPEHLLGYVDERNPILRDYRATIGLEPLDGGRGTAIRWRGTYRTRLGTGLFMTWYLRRFQQKMVDGLAEHAAVLHRRDHA